MNILRALFLTLTLGTLITVSACNSTKSNSTAHDTQQTGEAAGNHEVIPAEKTNPGAIATPTASANSDSNSVDHR